MRLTDIERSVNFLGAKRLLVYEKKLYPCINVADTKVDADNNPIKFILSHKKTQISDESHDGASTYVLN